MLTFSDNGCPGANTGVGKKFVKGAAGEQKAINVCYCPGGDCTVEGKWIYPIFTSIWCI